MLSYTYIKIFTCYNYYAEINQIELMPLFYHDMFKNNFVQRINQYILDTNSFI